MSKSKIYHCIDNLKHYTIVQQIVIMHIYMPSGEFIIIMVRVLWSFLNEGKPNPSGLCSD